ncbi:nucleotidyl transferase AbiEii/AbiGii toxin family protein [Patescibacteria group bacterium]|nr:nucleotidyl transferase AbiEii/AbiGii toxin family protein [Patescibacteria group bacterium]
MGKTILTAEQQKLLSLLTKEKTFISRFYLTGGTALAEYYLHHRLSEDLDFFSEEEVELLPIQAFLKKNQVLLGFKKIQFNTAFNRSLFFVFFPRNYILKVEFTYFPFKPLDKFKKANDISVDSLIDIAVNKVFTIYQNPRSRDFIDLYIILQKESWKIADLYKKARLKFDWHVDPIKLADQFIKVKRLLKIDYPKMLVPFNRKKMEEFFLAEAKKLKKEILK